MNDHSGRTEELTEDNQASSEKEGDKKKEDKKKGGTNTENDDKESKQTVIMYNSSLTVAFGPGLNIEYGLALDLNTGETFLFWKWRGQLVRILMLELN